MNEVTTEEAVKRLILGAAPEREDDFLSLWNQYAPQIEFIEDKEGFSLEAGAFGLVLFNHKSMAQIWLLGFAAQYAFHAYLPYMKLSLSWFSGNWSFPSFELTYSNEGELHEKETQEIQPGRESSHFKASSG